MVYDSTITNSYSMDIIIKICITLFTFLIFLFTSAWYMTKKNYKFPDVVVIKKPIKHVKDLSNMSFLNDCYRAGCQDNSVTRIRPVSANIFQNKMAIVINDLDWYMNNKSSFIFTAPFSLAPKDLKRSWKGLLFHRDSREKDVLLCLMIKGFESLDWSVIHKSINFALRKSKLNEPNFSVDMSALLIAFDTICGYEVEDSKLDKKLIFINELSVLLKEFSSFFYTGNSWTENFDAEEIGEKLEQLLNPVIESAIYHCDARYQDDVAVVDASSNLLSQIALLRHHLKEDNADSARITVDDFSHCLFEHFFILTELIKECLHGVLTLVTSSPDIVDVITKEVCAETSTANDCSRQLVSEHQLESSHSLVYTKSSTQELARLLSLGTQFDLCLAERDGQLEDYDMREYSVLVFNHFAFCRSKCFGVRDSVDAEFFRPARFVRLDSNEKKYFFYNSCQLVNFQDQLNVVAVPRNYLCRLLLLLLVKLVSPDFDIVANNDDDRDRVQFELLYDIAKKSRWSDRDLVVE